MLPFLGKASSRSGGHWGMGAEIPKACHMWSSTLSREPVCALSRDAHVSAAGIVSIGLGQWAWGRGVAPSEEGRCVLSPVLQFSRQGPRGVQGPPGPSGKPGRRVSAGVTWSGGVGSAGSLWSPQCPLSAGCILLQGVLHVRDWGQLAWYWCSACFLGLAMAHVL